MSKTIILQHFTLKYRRLVELFGLFSLIAIIFLISSCDNSTEPKEETNDILPAISIEWSSNNSIVCFGTSITNGGNNADSSYPTLLGNELKINVINEGRWGDITTEGIERFDTDILVENPSLILLEFGANEFLRSYDVMTTKANLDSLIKIIKSNNIKMVLLSFINPEMLNNTSSTNPLIAQKVLAQEYYEMIVDVAKENNIPLIDYIYKDIWGKTALMSSDGVHPNNKGNVQLKKNIFDALYKTFEINNMLK